MCERPGEKGALRLFSGETRRWHWVLHVKKSADWVGDTGQVLQTCFEGGDGKAGRRTVGSGGFPAL